MNKQALKINFNDYVTVKLTKSGAEHLNELRQEFNLHYGFTQKANYVEGEEYSAQMWSLFQDFGSVNYFGREAPFKDCLMFTGTYENQS